MVDRLDFSPPIPLPMGYNSFPSTEDEFPSRHSPDSDTFAQLPVPRTPESGRSTPIPSESVPIPVPPPPMLGGGAPVAPAPGPGGSEDSSFSIEPFQRALGGTFELQENGSYIRTTTTTGGEERQDAGRYWPRQGGGLFYTGGATFTPTGVARAGGSPSNNAQVYSIGTGGGLATSTATPFDAFLASAGLTPGPTGGYIRSGNGNSGTWYLEPAQVGGNHVVSFSGGTINGEITAAGTYSLTLTEGIPTRLNATAPTNGAIVLAHAPGGGMRPVMGGDTLTWVQPSGFTAGTLTYQPATTGAGAHGARIAFTGAAVPPDTYYYADSPDPNNRVVLWHYIASWDTVGGRPAAPAALGGSPSLQERIDHYDQTSNHSGWYRIRRADNGAWVLTYRSGASTVHKRYNFTTRAWVACTAEGT